MKNIYFYCAEFIQYNEVKARYSGFWETELKVTDIESGNEIRANIEAFIRTDRGRLSSSHFFLTNLNKLN